MIEALLSFNRMMRIFSLFNSQLLTMSHNANIHHVKSILIKSLCIWNNIIFNLQWILNVSIDSFIKSKLILKILMFSLQVSLSIPTFALIQPVDIWQESMTLMVLRHLVGVIQQIVVADVVDVSVFVVT